VFSQTAKQMYLQSKWIAWANYQAVIQLEDTSNLKKRYMVRTADTLTANLLEKAMAVMTHV